MRRGAWRDVLGLSVGFGQAKYAFGDVAQDEVRRDWRDAVDECFTQIALDMIFLCIAHATVRHDGIVTGVEGCLTGKILGGIGHRASVVTAVV